MLAHTDCPDQCAACYHLRREEDRMIGTFADLEKFIAQTKEHH